MRQYRDRFIRLNSSVLYSDIFTSDRLFKLWVWLLFTANYKNSEIKFKGKKTTLEAGQLVTGLEEMAQAIRCSKGSIRNCLQYLINTSRISTETSTRGTIITILKYKDYHDTNKFSSTRISKPVANEKQLNNNIQYNNKNTHTSSGDDVSLLFEKYNQVCPNLPQCLVVTPKRKKKAADRLKELPGIESWVAVFEYVNSAPFYSGNNDRGWKASVDYLLQPGKALELFELAQGRNKKPKEGIIL